MKTPVRCILMDMGKVLVDIDLRRLGERLQAATGVGPEQLRAAFAADNLVARYESGRIGDAEFHREFCGRTRRDLPFEEFTAAWNSIFLPDPILDDDILGRLAAGCRLWVISNTNPIHYRFIQSHYGFLRHFAGCILSHEVGALKPEPTIFLRAVEKTGTAASCTLLVDDQETNVQAARALGFQAIRFVDPRRFAEDLRSLALL